MLSRTANSLYWLARYVERMDFVARMLEVGLRMGSMSGTSRDSEWTSTLIATGCEPGFRATGRPLSADGVIPYLARDPDNPSSILSCISTARANARAVRTALTKDMWDAVNETWLEAQALGDADFTQTGIARVLDWAKRRALQFNGAYKNTMLRSDAYYFTQLGTYVERADDTARILDVKYHVLLPSHEPVGGALDYHHWTALLRAVSALRAYHWVYKDRIKPWNVAELLVLRPEMPRSMRASFDQIVVNLDLLTGEMNTRGGEPHRLASELHARLKYARIDDIFTAGLHEVLTDYINRTARLDSEIRRFFLM
ncbi:alpha-E domain-containing protein [Futiania mangrovi]|uniref:Alpha-E domain-containing protein n=1 Tax=Futiania mangrovi TaxID=2959716 RepID=A0A9J6PEU4_9PROT|nr:alpha-E domain-containing protein [Futiania mangrovii]MCP1336352.1 alpha-E domain-containing protein [Futiania mangrovii]